MTISRRSYKREIREKRSGVKPAKRDTFPDLSYTPIWIMGGIAAALWIIQRRQS